MNFQGNFKHLGDVDVSPIKNLVEQLTDEHWLQESIRQKRFEVHQDTQFIGIAYDQDFRHIKPTRRPAWDLFGPALRSVFSLVADQYENSPEILAKFDRQIEGYFIRVSLVKLIAGGEISEHRDMGFSLTHSHRVHVPVITNEKVAFRVGEDTRNLHEGGVFEINNRRLHSVVNEGSEDRVHLILDWVFPWEPCCCSAIVHPGIPCSPEACFEIVRSETHCGCHPESQD